MIDVTKQTSIGVSGLIEHFVNLGRDIQTLWKKEQVHVTQVVRHFNMNNKVYHLFDDGTINEPTGSVIKEDANKFLATATFDGSFNTTKALITSDTRVYSLIDKSEYNILGNGLVYNKTGDFITKGGIQGLRTFLTAYYSVDGRIGKESGIFSFPSLNTNFSIQMKKPYNVKDSRGNFVCLPDDKMAEVIACTYDYIIAQKMVQVPKQANEIYKVYTDSLKRTFRVYKFGLVVTEDLKIVSLTGGLSGLTEFLLKDKATLGPVNPSSTFYEATNGFSYEITFSGVVSQGGKVICQAGGLACLTNFINPKDIIDYEIVVGEGIKYKLFKQTGVVTYENGTVICKEGGLPCLTKFLTKTITTTVSAGYSIVQNAQANEEYHLYDNTSVTFKNGTLICAKGGMICLNAWLQERAKASAYDVVDLPDGRRVFIYSNGEGRVQPANTLLSTGGITGLKAWLAATTPSQISVGQRHLHYLLEWHCDFTFRTSCVQRRRS